MLPSEQAEVVYAGTLYVSSTSAGGTCPETLGPLFSLIQSGSLAVALLLSVVSILGVSHILGWAPTGKVAADTFFVYENEPTPKRTTIRKIVPTMPIRRW